jgi:L-ascorbate metabolism protein UlaG (beta-lactamase superfamily)
MDKLDWLGHDSFRITGSKTIYVDPWKLRGDPPPADIILVTHEHFDHLSKADIAKLSTPATVVVGPAEVTSQIKGDTITVTPGDMITVQGVVVSAVPAYNVSKFRSPGVPYHAVADGKVGYVVEMDGRRIYHAGDTDAIPEMAQIEADVALIPVSGTFVMTAEEAAEACRTLRAKVAVPMHYGSIVGSRSDAQRFKELCSLPVEILEPVA